MTCPLCLQRKARRACPALGQHICTVCCATKRLVEIACPSDCPYLASAREHPPARVVRQQDDDLGSLVRHMRDFNDRQARLFFLILTFLSRHAASRHPELPADRYLTPELQTPLVDEDISAALAALAATYETASRGVLYEHRPQSLPAERLVDELKPLLKAGQTGGSAFEREAAVVLRRLELASRQAPPDVAGHRRAFLELVGRVIRAQGEGEPAAAEPETAPRLIIP